MGQVPKRGKSREPSELAKAEAAALAAVKKIRRILLGPAPDFKAAGEAQKVVSRFIRLRNQQGAAATASSPRSRRRVGSKG